ncbi:alpha/beta hydrolase fold domain-containing protein [Roseicyclus persicicus]|uniref:Alpha/beta hydrolase fold domain-containing protein n=1 Tax=Roseicyclus persicicus TaxID=2650661 RepID=A0A7X6GYG3_9RHOB|nr:alpha/beta hydrolase fold domain-containing protein [Roseibacterium persicicum]NKX44701.1 alpha/beta hydrolase fold domain-containing protein [Roseibacterium persicicum]
MTAPTRTDRLWRALARHVDRTALDLIPSQPALRRLLDLSARLGTALPPGTTATRDPDGTLHLRPPGTAADAPVLLYIHGGGFTLGSPRAYAALAGHLAQAAGMRAVLPAYRLAPEHPFPAARDDVIAAHARLLAAGTPPAALAGDSAGGCLALLLARHLRDTGAPLPAALGLIAPIGDLSGDIGARFAAAHDEVLIPPAWARRIRAAYLPATDPADPAVSPLLSDLSGLPPALIQAATGEALAADARRLAAALDDATLDLWPGMAHVWHFHAGRSHAANTALRRMGAFLADKAAR